MLVETDMFGMTTDKVANAIRLIRDFEPSEGYYVAFSGGKDSVVILDLVKRSGVKFDAHYNITGIDPPELFYFIRDNFPEVQRHRPETTIWKLIVKKMMLPTRMVRYCCEYLKERGGAGRRVVTGVRKAESVKRSKRKDVEECFKDKHKVYINPIIDWSDQDVWEYIKTNNLKYCHLYDEGFKRLGCIGCPMIGKKKRISDFARWPRYETKFRKACDLAVRRRNNQSEEWKRDHPQIIQWPDGDAMFDWWVNDNHRKKDADQTVMFE